MSSREDWPATMQGIPAWVDYVRRRGNEANHAIVAMTRDDAMALITFVEMLLPFIDEFPRRVPIDIRSTAAP